MTKETQAVNGELSACVAEREQRARDAERVLARLLYVDEMCGVKEREKGELLTAYRAACAENARLDSSVQELELDKQVHPLFVVCSVLFNSV